MRWPVITLLTLLLGACTASEWTQDGKRYRSVSFGLAKFPDPGDSGLKIRTWGIGVQATFNGGSVGYFKTDAIYIPRDCFAMFVVRDASEAARIMDMVGGSENICIGG